MQNKRQVLLRPQRQSGHVDNLRFFTCIFWVGKKIAANGSWFKVGKKDLSDYWNCIFVLQCRISYLVGCVEGGGRETIFILLHGSIIQKLVFVLHLTRRIHVPVLPATLAVLCLLKLWCRSSLFTWSAFWLRWKVTSFPPVNLMEITDYWLYFAWG